MKITLEEFNHSYTKNDFSEIRSGDVVRVHQIVIEKKVGDKKLKDETKERIQVFEGFVISRRGGSGISANMTVRKISSGIGVERIFPLNSPTIEKIEIIRKGSRIRRAKLTYMRNRFGKSMRIRGKAFDKVIGGEKDLNSELNDKNKDK